MLFNAKCHFVSNGKGQVTYINDEGETFELHVPAGRVSCSEYVIDGYDASIKGLTVLWPRSAVSIFVPDNREETGANPDFQPHSADWQAHKTNLLIKNAVEKAVSQRVVNFLPSNELPTPAAPDLSSEVVEVTDDTKPPLP